MSGCTLRFARDTPLRTTLVDEVTGHTKYKIETPRRIAGSVTRIKKFDSPPQPPLYWDVNGGPNSGDDITDMGRKKKKKTDSKKGERNDRDEGGKTETESPEANDEMARIYWKWFSSDRIIFRGGITTRREFLPRTGKMKGQVDSPSFPLGIG